MNIKNCRAAFSAGTLACLAVIGVSSLNNTISGAPSAPHIAPDAISEQEAFEIGVEAYVYLYPIITMDVTRRVSTNLPAGAKSGLGPMNSFHHMRAYPSADFREVVRPNFDTLYSIAWLDLNKEPLVVSAPDTGGRYYLLPMLDMWTNAFAVPGARTSGTARGQWALVPPGWSGTLPKGVARIDAPTPYVWIIGRTQTNGPADYDAVHKVQDQYTITPLSKLGSKYEPPAFVPDPTVDMKTPPLVQVNTMPAEKYFSYGADLMMRHPPAITDWSVLARLERVGLRRGSSFDFNAAPPQVQAGLRRAVEAGLQLLKDKVPTLARVTNGWQMNTDTMGVYGTYYLKRAVIAMIGLGANQPEDAVYPLSVGDADGKPLMGEHRYALHFAKSEIPPVGAFWSVTMYDADGFPVANPRNRFAIGDRDALKFNADGSLTIYIQSASPGADKESNWLPSPTSGAISVVMRLYAPKPQVLDGRWNPPALKRVD
ncbi:MAG: DUF1254 domain-containing protein [Phycisphaerales bacterium]